MGKSPIPKNPLPLWEREGPKAKPGEGEGLEKDGKQTSFITMTGPNTIPEQPREIPTPDAPLPPPGNPGRDIPVPQETDRQREYGGRRGLDPTRYDDWEKDGKCVDF